MVLFFMIVLIDQISKFIVLKLLKPENIVPVINNYFYLTYIENVHNGFSIFFNKIYTISIISIVFLSILGYFIYRNLHKNKIINTSIALILGGAASNFLDKLRIGYTVNFIDIKPLPVLNIADISVLIGTLIIVLILLFS